MIELAEIFHKYGSEYLSLFQNKILPSHVKAMNAIMQCRTPSMGGKVYTCKVCKKDNYSYHSCNNRACPKCGGGKISEWIKKQFDLLLPVTYFFVTFTLPKEFRSIARSNQEYFYSLFFTTSAKALKILAREKRFAGGEIGFFGVIQTWARNLIYHPHIHYIVPKATLSSDRKKYIKIKNSNFLVHRTPLGRLFKRFFKEELQQSKFYRQIPDAVWEKDWVVHVKFAGRGREVIKYIAPYVFKTAISNRRIKQLAGNKVTFEYVDSDTKKTETCSLDVIEFIRRFLQHVLPPGFVKVRYFGIMGANVKDKWFLLKRLIFQRLSKKMQSEFLKIDFIYDKKVNHFCRTCGGELILTGTLPRGP